MKAIKRAAMLLREDARCIRRSSTVKGDWGTAPCDIEARQEVEEKLELADELDDIYQKISGETASGR